MTTASLRARVERLEQRVRERPPTDTHTDYLRYADRFAKCNATQNPRGRELLDAVCSALYDLNLYENGMG